jgi:hypothetical protein
VLTFESRDALNQNLRLLNSMKLSTLNKIHSQVLAVAFIISCSACNNPSSGNLQEIGDLPKVVTLDSTKATDFVVAMESQLDTASNIVYCPTLLYAWQEIKSRIGEVKLMPTASTAVSELIGSKGYKDALKSNQFSTSVKIEGREIIANAAFNAELTFEPDLERMKFPLRFKQRDVQGFGMIKYDKAIVNQVHVLYFEDNDNFIFKLSPEQKDDEIIFMMGDAYTKAKSFEELLQTLQQHKAIGENDIKNKTSLWKYKFKYGENFAIPELAFNLEKLFVNLVGQHIYTSNNDYTIAIAKQRNALLLNNKGAKIESETVVAALDAAAAPSRREEIIEKHLFLNKTFFVIFKQKAKSNPYLCLKIDNDELMTAFSEN